MPDYHVLWDIDEEAESPKAAAEAAREAQVRPGTIATIFLVTDKATRECFSVDLDEGSVERAVLRDARGAAATLAERRLEDVSTREIAQIVDDALTVLHDRDANEGEGSPSLLTPTIDAWDEITEGLKRKDASR